MRDADFHTRILRIVLIFSRYGSRRKRSKRLLRRETGSSLFKELSNGVVSADKIAVLDHGEIRRYVRIKYNSIAGRADAASFLIHF